VTSEAGSSVHELRELAGPEELLDHRRHRLALIRSCGHERLDLLQAHALLDRALHADQADAVLVLEQLATARTRRLPRWSMSSMRPSRSSGDEVADDLEDVLLGEDRLLERLVDAELVVQLERPTLERS